MRTFPQSGIRLIQAACLACGLALWAIPCIADSNLTEKSPFLPEGYGQAKEEPVQPVTTDNGPISRDLEFRGVIQFGGEFQFSVFSKKSNKGYWLRENVSQDGISASRYDPKTKTITVVMNGRSERLTLLSATDSPLPISTSTTASKQETPSRPNISPRNNNTSNNNERRRVIPRRRVILPNQN
ncbi:hypothetical protein [Coraliomargarita parva]|uniref:hypothetical protein n=1 Tax=Coraliomargarita parva TaxID=3014050 RepID=UPI0022B325EE|nr:hypothetical protein [Coraliomargarita parva]